MGWVHGFKTKSLQVFTGWLGLDSILNKFV